MEEIKLTETEKIELLRIARQIVAGQFQGGSRAISTDMDGLQREGGAFVTLHKKGELRGCIGNFFSDKPLYKTVAEMALSAAFKDPRFSPLRENELDELDFEISVLSPLRQIEDAGEIEVGRHGIFITKGAKRGVLLPQVAREYGWDRETFLEHTCMKAGLPSDEWRHGAKIEVFSAQVFGEKAS
ncbi:MAG: AmmeMemoRadiSam system protein A [Proteobacteria bacterium]|nr:AmmeMemoRadiSam system protein A [Pseudomonadota bacterium]